VILQNSNPFSDIFAEWIQLPRTYYVFITENSTSIIPFYRKFHALQNYVCNNFALNFLRFSIKWKKRNLSSSSNNWWVLNSHQRDVSNSLGRHIFLRPIEIHLPYYAVVSLCTFGIYFSHFSQNEFFGIGSLWKLSVQL